MASTTSALSARDESKFTTSSKNRYTEDKVLNTGSVTDLDERTETHGKALNDSSFDNSDLSDLDKELSASAGSPQLEIALVVNVIRQATIV